MCDTEGAAQLHCGDPAEIDGEFVDRGSSLYEDSFESFMTETDLIGNRLRQSLNQ